MRRGVMVMSWRCRGNVLTTSWRWYRALSKTGMVVIVIGNSSNFTIIVILIDREKMKVIVIVIVIVMDSQVILHHSIFAI